MVVFYRFPLCAVLWLLPAPGLWAQSPAPGAAALSAVPGAPLAPSKASGLAYVSVLGQYQAYAEQKVTSWPQANATVQGIGGWRAYAKEIATEAATPQPRGAQP
jgi:hypothetical protein